MNPVRAMRIDRLTSELESISLQLSWLIENETDIDVTHARSWRRTRKTISKLLEAFAPREVKETL